MSFEKLTSNIFHVLNVSVAFACAFWLILIRQCYINIMPGIAGGVYTVENCPGYMDYLARNGFVDRIDSFFVVTFYLIFLLLTIGIFLFAQESWINKIKSWKIFFLTANLIFIAFLFFEV